MNSKKISMSGMVIALYIVLIYVFQEVSFGAVQLRLANSLYALCTIYPALVIPMGIAVILSNLLFGGLGIIDIVCGAAVTVMTCYTVSKIGSRWFMIIPIILIPGLLVPIWLSLLLKIPYMVLMPGVLVGQIIPSLTGLFLVKALSKNKNLECIK